MGCAALRRRPSRAFSPEFCVPIVKSVTNLAGFRARRPLDASRPQTGGSARAAPAPEGRLARPGRRMTVRRGHFPHATRAGLCARRLRRPSNNRRAPRRAWLASPNPPLQTASHSAEGLAVFSGQEVQRNALLQVIKVAERFVPVVLVEHPFAIFQLELDVHETVFHLRGAL